MMSHNILRDHRPGSWITPKMSSNTIVAAAEIRSDFRQPIRLVKKSMGFAFKSGNGAPANAGAPPQGVF